MNRWIAFFAVAIALIMNSSCGGYKNNTSTGGGGNSATIMNLVSSMTAGATYTFNASTPNSNGYTAGITWSVSGGGTLGTPTVSGFSSSVVFMAPGSAPSPNSITITATPTDTAVGAATDTFTIGTTTTPYVATLTGRYAFEVSGLDANGEATSIIGTISSDGSGHITAGALDMNDGNAVTVRSASLAGTYSLDSHFLGTLALSAGVSGNEQPLSFDLSLASDGKTGILTGGGASGFHMTGKLAQQDASAFSLAKIASEFAFKLESSSNERVATVGKLSIGENSNIVGLADSSKAGASPLLASARVAGRVTASPDSNGRGTLSLATRGENSQLVYFVVSGNEFFLMESVSGNGGAARAIGVAKRQMLPFVAATANAASLFSAAGFDQKAPGPVSVAGRLSIENLTHATIDWDSSVAGSTLSQTGLRSEVVAFDAATGRGTIQIANGYSNNFADSVVFYLAGSGNGFLLDTTAGEFNRAIAGDLRPAVGGAAFGSR
jgi:hypothetical protein